MRLGINAVGLFPGQIGGAEQYIRNIVKEISKIQEVQVFLFVNDQAYDTFDECENLFKCRIDTASDVERQLTQRINECDLDMWFCPLFHLNPPGCVIPSVVAIFDIQQEYFPENFTRKELRARRKNMRETLTGADRILTISEFSKQTIIEKYGLENDSIAVTLLDADDNFNGELDRSMDDQIRSIYNLPENYIFYPANSWPHKNHYRLIKAFYELKKNENFAPKLVLTGAHKQTQKKINRYIKRHGLIDDILYLGYVEQSHMPYIFANADMLVFPSLFEGFGIPLLEAMRTGTPITCSQCGSIPEICQDAALYFDATSAKDIAEKISHLHSNVSLKQHLVEKGFERAKKFSWQKCAQQTIDVMYDLLKQNQTESKDSLPLVSIITPSFNQGQFIQETIDSVLTQNYPNIEYIVIDGGSTDNTIEILKSYGDRINWISEKDGGQADAVNKGLKIARGSIIGWLNSDDTYLVGAISCAVDFLIRHPKVDMVYGEGYYTDVNSSITGRYATEPYHYDTLAERCLICQPAAFFRKSIVDSIGGLDPKLQLCMDYEFWVRIAKHGCISSIPQYLATSRLYQENKTMSRRKEIFIEVCAMIKRHYGYLPVSWAAGYSDYLCVATRGKRFYLKMLTIFLWYNMSNPIYLLKFTYRYLGNRLFPSKAIPNMQGQYTDKWLSHSYFIKILAYEEKHRVIIRGDNSIWPLKTSLEINVYINEKINQTIYLTQKDHFTYVVDLAMPLSPGYHEIRLEMPHTFIPAEYKISQDKRELSFCLKEIVLD